MDECHVLIVGGGPAGSTCAWRLRDAGVDVVLADKEPFPRDKVCGGWVTPAVFKTLGLDPDEYRKGRVFQPISRFLTSIRGEPALETSFDQPVSFGVWRREFDHYLLQRAEVRTLEGFQVRSLQRETEGWLVNHTLRARVVVGAGGHFCPVARHLGSRPSMEHSVHAQEAEWEMDARCANLCSVRGNTPELYFDADLRGYGWCFRKGRRLNVGYGRLDDTHVTKHLAELRTFLQTRRCVNAAMPETFRGHAYLLRNTSTRPPVADGILLVGDAAGLAFPASGEGILPAVESGILAAEAILAAGGRYDTSKLSSYAAALEHRFGKATPSLLERTAQQLPAPMVRLLAKQLVQNRRFLQGVILEKWFLHRQQAPMALAETLVPQ
jgi:geranylgeranyl reductase family protein